jgi:hypothetical protein
VSTEEEDDVGDKEGITPKAGLLVGVLGRIIEFGGEWSCVVMLYWFEVEVTGACPI